MKRVAQKIMQEEYNRLKKVIEKFINPKQGSAMPHLVLQPVRQKKY